MLKENDTLRRILDDAIPGLAASEEISPETIRSGLEAGTMVLLANPAHAGVTPTLIGRPARIKINANIGTSPFLNDPEREKRKLQVAAKAGAHAVMDLSTAGDLRAIRRDMLAATPLPLGTVPIYSVAQKYIGQGQDPALMSADELFDEIAAQAAEGVDFMTVHCGVTARAAELAAQSNRLLGVVSRGGSILARWMRRNDRENPLFERYDELLDIVRPANVTLSLGDGMRPGAGADAGDPAQWEEVIELARLAVRAQGSGVQAMIEGPGHVPLHQVQAQIQGIKRLCRNAPLYVLGPLVTDRSPGRDHMSGAIGGALAAWFGADFLCYLTPAEHLTLPDESDVHEGVMASRIAAQAAEVALGVPAAVRAEETMSKARMALDWPGMEAAAIDPCIVRTRRAGFEGKEECAMCGEFCAVKMLR